MKTRCAYARAHLEKVLEIEEQLFGGRDHYSTAQTEQALGFLLLQMDEAEEGVKLLVHVLQTFRSQLGPEHPYTQQLGQYLASLSENGEGD